MAILHDCPDELDLREFALGQLTDQQSEQLQEHLAHCARCVEALGALPADDALVESFRSQRNALARPEDNVVEVLIWRLSGLHAAPSSCAMDTAATCNLETSGATLA